MTRHYIGGNTNQDRQTIFTYLIGVGPSNRWYSMWKTLTMLLLNLDARASKQEHQASINHDLGTFASFSFGFSG